MRLAQRLIRERQCVRKGSRDLTCQVVSLPSCWTRKLNNVHSRKSKFRLGLGVSQSDIPQTKIADLVQITPEDFGKDAAQAIEDNINAKYANKVIQKIGLCICLYDLLEASEGLIGHGDGLVNVNGKPSSIPLRH